MNWIESNIKVMDVSKGDIFQAYNELAEKKISRSRFDTIVKEPLKMKLDEAHVFSQLFAVPMPTIVSILTACK